MYFILCFCQQLQISFGYDIIASIIIMEKIKKNDEFVVTIDRYGDSGEGIAVYNGIVVFVPFAKVGDTVKVHVINDKKSFLIAKIIEKISSAKNETFPPCP